MKFAFIVLFIIISTGLHSQHSHKWKLVRSKDSQSNAQAFQFQKNAGTKQVLVGHDLAVHYRRLRNNGQDSLSYRVRGAYVAIKNDSIVIDAADFKIHDRYKWNVDSAYRRIKNTRDGYARVSLGEITSVFYERAEWKKVTTGVTILALLTAFAVAPFLAVENNKLDPVEYRKVAYPALGIAVVSVGLGFAFSQRKFFIQTTKHNRTGWKIKPTN
jgi:hypothetical protein